MFFMLIAEYTVGDFLRYSRMEYFINGLILIVRLKNCFYFIFLNYNCSILMRRLSIFEVILTVRNRNA